jgi:hypothetical protein
MRLLLLCLSLAVAAYAEGSRKYAREPNQLLAPDASLYSSPKPNSFRLALDGILPLPVDHYKITESGLNLQSVNPHAGVETARRRFKSTLHRTNVSMLPRFGSLTAKSYSVHDTVTVNPSVIEQQDSANFGEMTEKELADIVNDPNMKEVFSRHQIGDRFAAQRVKDAGLKFAKDANAERDDANFDDPVLAIHASLEADIRDTLKARMLQRKLHRRTQFKADELFFPGDAVTDMASRLKSNKPPPSGISADVALSIRKLSRDFNISQMNISLSAEPEDLIKPTATKAGSSEELTQVPDMDEGESGPHAFAQPCGKCLLKCGDGETACCSSCITQSACSNKEECRVYNIHPWAVMEDRHVVAADEEADARARASNSLAAKKNWQTEARYRKDTAWVSDYLMHGKPKKPTALDAAKKALAKMASQTQVLIEEAQGKVAYGEIVTTLPFFIVGHSAGQSTAL